MKIVKDTITFKSHPEFFLKEKYGSKPNTARILPPMELHKFNSVSEHIGFIEIVNTDTGESFKRELTDISRYKDMVIFSWRNYKLIDT